MYRPVWEFVDRTYVVRKHVSIAAVHHHSLEHWSGGELGARPRCVDGPRDRVGKLSGPGLCFWRISSQRPVSGFVDTPPVWEICSGGEGLVAPLLTRSPLGRLAAPEEVAAQALFLLPDAARLVAGQVLAADGGRLGERCRERAAV